MKVYKVKHLEMAGSFTVDNFKDAVDEIELSNVGDSYQIDVIEMSQEDLDKLPEFEGW